MGIANNATALGKELWPQKSIDLNLLEGSPVIGLASSDTEFGEDVRHHYVNYSSAQGLSSTYATAKANKTAAKRVRFDVSTRPYFGEFSVDGATWRRFQHTGNKGLVMDEVARNAETIMQQARNDYSSYIHGDGVGVLGRITTGSTITTATVTLTLGADGRRIQEGMSLETESTGATGGTINPGQVTVLSINGTDDAPTVTVDQASWQAGIPAVATSDYIYRAGTYDSVFYGLAGWCPYWLGSTPGTFLGANRNLSPKKLAGHVLDGTVMDPMTRMYRASRILADSGWKPDTYLMSTRNWEQLQTQLQGQGRLISTKVPANKIGGYDFGVTYEAISFTGAAGGTLNVIADPWMPDNRERCFVRKMLQLCSTGPLLHWDEGSAPGDARSEETQDARMCKLVGDSAVIVQNPFAFCTIAVTP